MAKHAALVLPILASLENQVQLGKHWAMPWENYPQTIEDPYTGTPACGPYINISNAAPGKIRLRNQISGAGLAPLH